MPTASPGSMTAFPTKLKGVSHSNPGDGAVRQSLLENEICRRGDLLKLQHLADNPYDRNAVAAKTQSGIQVAWIPKERAPEVANALDAGKSCGAYVYEIREKTEQHPHIGVSVYVFMADSDLPLEDIRQEFLDWAKREGHEIPLQDV